MNEWMNEWMNECIYEWMNEWKKERMNEWMNKRMNECIYELQVKKRPFPSAFEWTIFRQQQQQKETINPWPMFTGLSGFTATISIYSYFRVQC